MTKSKHKVHESKRCTQSLQIMFFVNLLLMLKKKHKNNATKQNTDILVQIYAGKLTHTLTHTNTPGLELELGR